MEEIQRSRILGAMAEEAAIRGASSITVARVIARAGVSRRLFYEQFADIEDCFLATFDWTIEQARAVSAEAYTAEQDWRKAIRAGLGALLHFFDEQPLLAQLCIVHAAGAGPRVLERRSCVIASLCEVVDRGRAEISGDQVPGPVVAEGVVGAVLAVLYTRLLARGADSAGRPTHGAGSAGLLARGADSAGRLTRGAGSAGLLARGADSAGYRWPAGGAGVPASGAFSSGSVQGSDSADGMGLEQGTGLERLSDLAGPGSERGSGLANRGSANQGAQLIEMHGELMSLIVLPYLGAADAARELRRPAPAPRPRPAPIDSLQAARRSTLEEPGARLTYRTVRVLRAIGELPAGSNREVAERAGIVDQGQISKVLTRLELQGLVVNRGIGRPARGTPNSWWLTERGETLEQSLREQPSDERGSGRLPEKGSRAGRLPEKGSGRQPGKGSGAGLPEKGSGSGRLPEKGSGRQPGKGSGSRRPAT